MKIIVTFPYLLIFGQDLVYWTGMLSGCVFVLILITAIVKQFNYRKWIKYRPFMTKYHKWLGWTAAFLMLVHVVLAILQFNFHVFF